MVEGGGGLNCGGGRRRLLTMVLGGGGEGETRTWVLLRPCKVEAPE